VKHLLGKNESPTFKSSTVYYVMKERISPKNDDTTTRKNVNLTNCTKAIDSK